MATKKQPVRLTGHVRKHKGFILVETGHNYYHACRGGERVAVGSKRHGDGDELWRRMVRIIDERESRCEHGA